MSGKDEKSSKKDLNKMRDIVIDKLILNKVLIMQNKHIKI